MPIFQYEGLTETGKETDGLVDADSAREARAKLRGDRIHVTRMLPMAEEGARSSPGLIGRIRLPRRASATMELVVATRQLSVLLGAGIPLAESLAALIEQAETRRTEAVLRNVRERIVQGANFADALAAHPGTFSDLYVNMVRAGEASGALDEILGRLADYLQKQARIRGKVTAALTYPTFMVIIAVAVVAVLMTVVVPRILQVLEANVGSGGNRSLPLPTQVLIVVSSFFRDYWWLLLAGVIVLVFLFRGFTSTHRGRLAWDRFKLNVWVLGPLYRKAAISRFSVTLATLLRSGLPVTNALLVVKDVVDNVVMSDAIGDIHNRIIEGADISTPIKESGLFPPVVGYMVAIGEQSGQLDDILERLAEAYDEELEQTSTKVTSILEPCLIVALAFVVGGIVFAIILPMLQIAQVNK
jgi:general secretion pathway protein F